VFLLLVLPQVQDAPTGRSPRTSLSINFFG